MTCVKDVPPGSGLHAQDVESTGVILEIYWDNGNKAETTISYRVI